MRIVLNKFLPGTSVAKVLEGFYIQRRFLVLNYNEKPGALYRPGYSFFFLENLPLLMATCHLATSFEINLDIYECATQTSHSFFLLFPVSKNPETFG